MKQKIEWYREVLELEPGSRVFFPLAKELVISKHVDEAIDTLQHGLTFHPNNLEARLFLIELLAKSGKQEIITKELSALSNLFCNYPSFWGIWSTHLAQDPLKKDAALALRFFASALSGKKITWASVIDKGLASSLNADVLLDSDNTSSKSSHSSIEKNENTTSSLIDHKEDLSSEVSENISPTLQHSKAEADKDFSIKDESEDEQEEPFSLRTRSMADVLAEQGDIQGALDIYQELLSSSHSTQESSELLAVIEELTQKSISARKEETDVPESENNRLVNLLESLAQRLESRAR